MPSLFLQATQPSEEILVTALKRVTSLQDTPISMMALSAASLRRVGSDSLADRHSVIPGLTIMHNGGGGRRLSLRGVLSVGEPQVGLYYDETPVVGSPGTTSDSGSFAPDFSFFDVERVEVLRGPQGTLYGAGSMGGTVRLIYAKPDMTEVLGLVSGGLQSTRHGGVGVWGSGMVNLPVVDDKLALRAVVNWRDEAGYVDNPLLGIKDINRKETTGGRLLARLLPADQSSLILSVNWQRDVADDEGRWSRDAGAYHRLSEARLPYRDDNLIANATFEHSFDHIKMTAVTSYYVRKMSATVDTTQFMRTLDTDKNCARLNDGLACDMAARQEFSAYVGSFLPSVLIYEPQDVRNWINEFRLSSNDEAALHWTLGLFAENRRSHIVSSQYKVDPLTGQRQPGSGDDQITTSRDIRDDLKQTAIFGELTYALTETVALTAGTRYFDYSKSIIGETTRGLDLLGAVVKPPTKVKSGEDGWIFKFHGSYKPTEDLLIYAQASEGFRPGGVNQVIGLPGALAPYGADRLWNYEIGAKSSWFDNRLIANIAGYWINWKNMQITARSANSAYIYISNTGTARIRGLEFEMILRPTEGVELTASANYIAARLQGDQILDTMRTPGLKGDAIPNVPECSASLSLQYLRPVKQELVAFLRGDITYIGPSHTEFRPTDSHYDRQGDFMLVNLRGGFESSDWDAYLYVNNVFDSLAPFTVISSEFVRQAVTSAPPRTIGLSVTRRW
nr:TonB-dependent receptor [Govania unica]